MAGNYCANRRSIRKRIRRQRRNNRQPDAR
jgi:hypothetical protein